MQSSINADPLDDDTINDDLSIQISSVEAKLLINGDQLDPAIRESIENTLAAAKTALESGSAEEQQTAIEHLKDHAGLFPG